MIQPAATLGTAFEFARAAWNTTVKSPKVATTSLNPIATPLRSWCDHEIKGISNMMWAIKVPAIAATTCTTT